MIMKKQEIQEYIDLHEKMEIFCEEIFDYVKDNYRSQLSISYPTFADFEFWDNELTIKYRDYYEDSYDSYRFSLPKIPIDMLDDVYEWRKLLDDYYEEAVKKEEERKKRKEKEKEEMERELLKELKENYEKI